MVWSWATGSRSRRRRPSVPSAQGPLSKPSRAWSIGELGADDGRRAAKERGRSRQPARVGERWSSHERSREWRRSVAGQHAFDASLDAFRSTRTRTNQPPPWRRGSSPPARTHRRSLSSAGPRSLLLPPARLLRRSAHRTHRCSLSSAGPAPPTLLRPFATAVSRRCNQPEQPAAQPAVHTHRAVRGSRRPTAADSDRTAGELQPSISDIAASAAASADGAAGGRGATRTTSTPGISRASSATAQRSTNAPSPSTH